MPNEPSMTGRELLDSLKKGELGAIVKFISHLSDANKGADALANKIEQTFKDARLTYDDIQILAYVYKIVEAIGYSPLQAYTTTILMTALRVAIDNKSLDESLDESLVSKIGTNDFPDNLVPERLKMIFQQVALMPKSAEIHESLPPNITLIDVDNVQDYLNQRLNKLLLQSIITNYLTLLDDKLKNQPNNKPLSNRRAVIALLKIKLDEPSTNLSSLNEQVTQLEKADLVDKDERTFLEWLQQVFSSLLSLEKKPFQAQKEYKHFLENLRKNLPEPPTADDSPTESSQRSPSTN